MDCSWFLNLPSVCCSLINENSNWRHSIEFELNKPNKRQMEINAAIYFIKQLISEFISVTTSFNRKLSFIETSHEFRFNKPGIHWLYCSWRMKLGLAVWSGNNPNFIPRLAAVDCLIAVVLNSIFSLFQLRHWNQLQINS